MKTEQEEWLEKELLWREIEKANREFMQKPWWVQQTEEGDYMSDGSDLQEYDIKEEQDERN